MLRWVKKQDLKLQGGRFMRPELVKTASFSKAEVGFSFVFTQFAPRPPLWLEKVSLFLNGPWSLIGVQCTFLLFDFITVLKRNKLKSKCLAITATQGNQIEIQNLLSLRNHAITLACFQLPRSLLHHELRARRR